MNSRKLLKIALANLLPQPVYLRINAHVAARDIASRRRWASEIGLLPRFVKPGDTVVDVGGNHGLYTYHLSHMVGPTGTVHTFEPLPPNLGILQHTVSTHHLNNVTIHRQGCGDRHQRTKFGAELDHGILQLGGGRQGGQGLQYDCEIVRLDDVIDARISFLKIDVEGAELFVLRGAQRTLRESRPVILFEAGDITHAFGYPQQAVFDFLSGFGYRFFSGGYRGLAMEPRERFTEVEDYFCIPAEVAA